MPHDPQIYKENWASLNVKQWNVWQKHSYYLMSSLGKPPQQLRSQQSCTLILMAKLHLWYHTVSLYVIPEEVHQSVENQVSYRDSTGNETTHTQSSIIPQTKKYSIESPNKCNEKVYNGSWLLYPQSIANSCIGYNHNCYHPQWICLATITSTNPLTHKNILQ